MSLNKKTIDLVKQLELNIAKFARYKNLKSFAESFELDLLEKDKDNSKIKRIQKIGKSLDKKIANNYIKLHSIIQNKDLYGGDYENNLEFKQLLESHFKSLEQLLSDINIDKLKEELLKFKK